MTRQNSKFRIDKVAITSDSIENLFSAQDTPKGLPLNPFKLGSSESIGKSKRKESRRYKDQIEELYHDDVESSLQTFKDSHNPFESFNSGQSGVEKREFDPYATQKEQTSKPLKSKHRKRTSQTFDGRENGNVTFASESFQSKCFFVVDLTLNQ